MSAAGGPRVRGLGLCFRSVLGVRHVLPRCNPRAVLGLSALAGHAVRLTAGAGLLVAAGTVAAQGLGNGGGGNTGVGAVTGLPGWLGSDGVCYGSAIQAAQVTCSRLNAVSGTVQVQCSMGAFGQPGPFVDPTGSPWFYSFITTDSAAGTNTTSNYIVGSVAGCDQSQGATFPFNLSATDGTALSVAILAVWAIGYVWSALVRTLNAGGNDVS